MRRIGVRLYLIDIFKRKVKQSENEQKKIQEVPLQPGDEEAHEKHVRNFIESVRSRKAPICEIESGHNVAIVAHMGNIAYRTASQLSWDDSKARFEDNASANKLVKPEYRSPWKFPA